jgi:cholesterol oxidase
MTALNVTEWMRGFIGVGANDADAGAIKGFEEASPFEHNVVIHMSDIDRFVSEPTHVASMTGTIDCPLFGGKCDITTGVYNMLIHDEDPALSFILYRISFTNADGAPFTLLGHKTIQNDGGLDILSEITTLTVRIYRGDVAGPDVATTALGPARLPSDPPFAMGKLHIHALDGLRSGASFEAPGAGTIAKWIAIEKFGRFYLKGLWDIYVKPGDLRP